MAYYIKWNLQDKILDLGSIYDLKKEFFFTTCIKN